MHRALILAVLLAGCGNERTPPPDTLTPAEPQGRRQVTLETAGVRFFAPDNWRTQVPRAGSLAGGVRSNAATVAVWRYRRSEPLPETRAQMRRVLPLLLDRVRLRDPAFQVQRKTVARDRITLVGTGTVGDLDVGVRSVHLFRHGAEIVVDAYAPREHFPRLDAQVFQPLMSSVRVSRPRR